MNFNSWWTLALLLYVVPFGLWQISYDDGLRAQKRRHPERPVLEDRRFLAVELLWAVGLVALFWVRHLDRQAGAA